MKELRFSWNGQVRARSPNMARKLDDVMAALPKDRQKRVQARAMELVTLKDLRQAVQQTRGLKFRGN
jgi:hypothetical protein